MSGEGPDTPLVYVLVDKLDADVVDASHAPCMLIPAAIVSTYCFVASILHVASATH